MIEFRYRNGKPDETLKRCYDCRFLKGAVNTWCTHKSAVEARGTGIPGVRNCRFWMPMKKAKWYHKFQPWAFIIVDCD